MSGRRAIQHASRAPAFCPACFGRLRGGPLCVSALAHGVQAAPPGQVPHLWVCSRCKLVFRSPDLRAEDHFDNVSYVDHANEADWRKIKERPFTEMVRRAAAYFDSAGPRRMVDFGCSYGHLALKFKAAGWEPIGVDVSQPVLEYHRQAGTMPAYAALDAPEIADGSVQLIAMSDVLCLVDRPVELLRTALRKLADPGLVFVRVSSLSRPIRIAVCLRRLFGIDLLPRLELDHKTYWTIQAARLAAERAASSGGRRAMATPTRWKGPTTAWPRPSRRPPAASST